MNTDLPLILTAAFAGVFLLAAFFGWHAAMKANSALKEKELELAGQGDLSARVDELRDELAAVEEAHLGAERKVSALEQQVKHYEAREGERQKEREQLQQQFTAQFENLANKIFEEKQKAFSERSNKGLNDILNPLKERFMEFQKKVDETYGQHAKEQHHLKQEIGRIIEMNGAMKLQAENLTKALKGDVKAQGNWGEIILEKVLEASGLRKGEDYTLQGEGMGLRHVDSGGHLKPDVIVHLPENKHLIIDSKVSLTHYERYTGEADEQARALHLKQFVASIKTHVNGLESKRYQDTEGLGTPDFVLMFLPIEGAYALAVQSDDELHAYAWDKRIFIVSPSTLFPILRTVASIWRMDLQNKNAMEIAKRGGALYDKVAGFVEDMQRLGKQMQTASGTYDDAMTKLSDGRGNILRQTEQLKELGAKTSKQLPVQLLEEADEKESA